MSQIFNSSVSFFVQGKNKNVNIDSFTSFSVTLCLSCIVNQIQNKIRDSLKRFSFDVAIFVTFKLRLKSVFAESCRFRVELLIP